MAQLSQADRTPYVLGFVGENENGILSWWTRRILEALSRHGLASKLIDISSPSWRNHLADHLVVEKPMFCFSFQGFGMNLMLNGENYWCLNQIPFISHLGDSPYHAPALHAAEGPGLYLLYSCADFLDVYRDHLDGRACAGLLGPGFPDNPHADATPWGERPHCVVFAKTGIDPAQLKQAWVDLPRRIRALLHESAEHVLTGTDMTVAAVCAAAFERSHLHCGVQRELFLFACSTVDRYVRAVRAERMVRALLPHDALIVGDWSHLDRPGARACFQAPMEAGKLDALYAESRVVANTSPSVRRGLHERIMAGLFAKAAVLSDTTPFLDRLLADCPSFLGHDIDDAGFPERLGDTLQAALSDDAMPEKLARSADVARARFSLDDFAQALLDHLDLEVHRRRVEDWWSFPSPNTARRPAPLSAAA